MVNRAELFIKEKGQHNAQTILFLHASGSSSRMWQQHMAALARDFHCLAVDLPGHGMSRNRDWTAFDDTTEILAGIIKSKAHGRVHLVGLSLGACLALKLLESHAWLIDRAIIDGAAHEPIKGYRKVIAGVFVMSLLKNTKFIARLMTGMMQKDGASEQSCRIFVEDLQRASRKSFRRAMTQANRLKLNLAFDNPALFLSGSKESETIQASHQLLAVQHPLSQCAYYPGKGHAWLFSDPDTHIQAISYFLQGGVFPASLQTF